MMRLLPAVVRGFCLIFSIVATCHLSRANTQVGARPPVVDIQQILSWLPADTETLLAATGPFQISSSPKRTDPPQNSRLTVRALDQHFEEMAMSKMLYLRNGQLESVLRGKEVLLAVEGSRHFRAPTGLGEMLYEGCEIAVFASELTAPRDEFFRNVARSKLRTEEIEEQRVAVLQEELEQDTWTMYVAFPQANVVVVATDRDFLRQVLARMRGVGGKRALPETLPEWKQIDRGARFWGIRHFYKEDSDQDPTSPYRDQQFDGIGDKEAIGLTFQCDPGSEMKASLTYLTKQRDALKLVQQWFPVTGEPDPGDTAGLHIQYSELEPGIVQGTYDVSESGPLDWFIFVLLEHLGHAILV